MDIHKKIKSLKIKTVFIWICSILFLLFTLSAILIGVGVIKTIDNQQNYSITSHVCLESSKTEFNDEFISITLNNISNIDFKDEIIHLIYLDNSGKTAGAAYSEQKIVTINANSTKTITFVNPGWTYSQYNEIYACVKEHDSSSAWITLKNGREFNDYRQKYANAKLYLTISESLLALLFFAIDVLLIVSVKKRKNQV